MFIVFDQDRSSDSPFVERVWTCHSERAGSFFSVASPLCEIVFTRLSGRIIVTLRGPETTARQVPCPSDGEWLAIRLKAGTFFPRFPTQRLIDGNDVNLPGVTRRSFWLDGASWECPDFDNAEAFVARLSRAGIIARDANVAAMLEAGDTQALSLRTIQRRFSNLCGMSYSTMRQIERARYAARLLAGGMSISDAQYHAGFYDQAHLTRSFKRFVGVTPAAISRGAHQMSFLYKK